MGNKASSFPLLSSDQILKRFSNEEIQQLETIWKSSPTAGRAENHHIHSSINSISLTKAEFDARFTKRVGPCIRSVLERFFKALDANRSGALEYEEYLAAIFFFTKATFSERARVLFTMYESRVSGSSSSSNNNISGVYLTKGDMATFYLESMLALAEYRQDSGVSTNLEDAKVQSPFKEMVFTMVDLAFARHDADRDGRLSLSEFQQFAQHQESAVVEDMLDLLTTSTSFSKLLDTS